jgi:RNA polymerase sigma-70 factor (ECF subfamily)
LIELTALLDRCRQGDELAWEALVRRFEGRVYRMALHYVRDAEEARDLAQEVFVRVWRHLGEGVEHATFVPWLLRLTRNASIDRLRRRRARREASELPAGAAAEPVSTDAGPEQQSLGAARRRLVWRALGRLGETSREILVLKEIEGLEVREISDLLALPEGTVKSRAHRARLELARAVLALDPSYGACP